MAVKTIDTDRIKAKLYDEIIEVISKFLAKDISEECFRKRMEKYYDQFTELEELGILHNDKYAQYSELLINPYQE